MRSARCCRQCPGPCHARTLPRWRPPAGQLLAQQGAQVRRQGLPGTEVGSKQGHAPVQGHGMHVRGDRLQPQPVARQRAGDGAVDAARLHTGNNLRERGVHRCGAQGAHKIGLRGRGHTHAAARQVSQGRERLLAKHDLRRIDIQRQQLHPMLFAQALFQKRPECRHAELETGAVRVQTGKVRRRVLGVVGRHGPHQHRAKRHHAQLQ